MIGETDADRRAEGLASEAPVRIEAPGFRLVVSRSFAAAARAEGLLEAAGFDAMMRTARPVPGGRGPNRILESRVFGASIRLRPMHHGGLLGPWLSDRFWTPARVTREFEHWLVLARHGVSLPEPVLAVSRRRGLFWRSALASVELTQALDGSRWLDTQPAPAHVREAARVFAQTLRRLHDAGGIHGDLHLGNVLIRDRDDSVECFLIDLDRARRRASVPARDRMRDLMRFARSLDKRGDAALLTLRMQARVLSEYCDGDRALRRSMLESVGAEVRRLRRHRLGWRLRRLRTVAFATALTAFAALQLGCPAETASGPPPDSRWSLLVTGDTGRYRAFAELLEGQLSVARQMTREARRHPVDGLVLLGDNFYWHGLERETAVDRIRTNLVRPYCLFLGLDGPRAGEVADSCPIAESGRSPVPIFAVLGNHDLERPESAELERILIPEFLPDWHMSATLARVFEVTPGVSLILFESELAIRDEAAIKQALRDAIRESRGPWRILATHRPIATDDLGFPPEGGYPVWVREALAESGRPVQLVLAGHHHNLQVFELGPPNPSLHIGLGSGSRAEPPLAQDHPDARFGAIELGFARVDLIGHDAQERLSVSIFDSAPWPWLGFLREARLRARFEVDRQGRVRRHALP